MHTESLIQRLLCTRRQCVTTSARPRCMGCTLRNANIPDCMTHICIHYVVQATALLALNFNVQLAHHKKHTVAIAVCQSDISQPWSQAHTRHTDWIIVRHNYSPALPQIRYRRVTKTPHVIMQSFKASISQIHALPGSSYCASHWHREGLYHTNFVPELSQHCVSQHCVSHTATLLREGLNHTED